MILLGDCLERLKELEENSVDAVVTDPPYGLSFMGKKWDYDVPSIDVWREILRVLKPGGHLLSFGGTRTYHRLVCAIDDAGFEIRDQIQWLYGSGFPKSLDISKAIDKHFGAEREVIGTQDVGPDMRGGNFENAEGRMIAQITKPKTPEAYRYKGWGTALKPANEPICLARKPLSEKTVAANFLKWGVGGLNIDESRVASSDPVWSVPESDKVSDSLMVFDKPGAGSDSMFKNKGGREGSSQGRWPANVLLECKCHERDDRFSNENFHSSDCPVGILNAQSGILKSGAFKQKGLSANTEQPGGWQTGNRNEKDFGPANSGGASRFFYCAKASKSERNAGLEGMEEKRHGTYDTTDTGGNKLGRSGKEPTAPQSNFHPTVKPIRLMEYLIKLITPPGGTVLDPFCGSGSTGVAAFKNGFKFVGIEMNEEYAKIAEKRIEAAL